MSQAAHTVQQRSEGTHESSMTTETSSSPATAGESAAGCHGPALSSGIANEPKQAQTGSSFGATGPADIRAPHAGSFTPPRPNTLGARSGWARSSAVAKSTHDRRGYAK
jgi:hypothetical protein